MFYKSPFSTNSYMNMLKVLQIELQILLQKLYKYIYKRITNSIKKYYKSFTNYQLEFYKYVSNLYKLPIRVLQIQFYSLQITN